MKLSLIACGAVLMLGCAKPPPHLPTKLEAVELLKAKTVALVHQDEDGDVRAYCSGVWVSAGQILTAYHCTHGGTEPIFYTTEADVFASGSSKPREKITPHLSSMEASDPEHDLALLSDMLTAPKHLVATITTAVVPGQFAQVVGQSVGLWWSYSSGDVAAIRFMEGAGDTEPMLFVQTTAPTSPGNSGGGLWNENAQLMGIAHASHQRGQNINLYVHPTYIVSFLKGKVR